MAGHGKKLLVAGLVVVCALAVVAQDAYRSHASAARSERQLVDMTLTLDGYVSGPVDTTKNWVSFNPYLSELELESKSFFRSYHFLPYAAKRQQRIESCSQTAYHTSLAVQREQLFMKLAQQWDDKAKEVRRILDAQKDSADYAVIRAQLRERSTLIEQQQNNFSQITAFIDTTGIAHRSLMFSSHLPLIQEVHGLFDQALSSIQQGDYNRANFFLDLTDAALDKLEADQTAAVGEFRSAVNSWGNELRQSVLSNQGKLSACVDELTY